MKRTIAIIQARIGSTRLPGKSLMDLCGEPVLSHVLRRCQAIPGVDGVCCATTTNPRDDAVAELTTALGARPFRGSEDNVLARYRDVAVAMEADIVLRVTGDCPLIDPGVCGRVLALRAEHDADFATNNMPPSWPHGLDCEAFTAALLRRAADEATSPDDREHVTPWMRRRDAIRKVNLRSEQKDIAHHRWTLDYPEDLEFLRALIGRFPKDGVLPDHQTVLDILDRSPSLAQLNALRVEPLRQHASALS
jgi:spore coat polysaccharide biosynthesis protein SpsF (cytidylyltransferase family)